MYEEPANGDTPEINVSPENLLSAGIEEMTGGVEVARDPSIKDFGADQPFPTPLPTRWRRRNHLGHFPIHAQAEWIDARRTSTDRMFCRIYIVMRQQSLVVSLCLR